MTQRPELYAKSSSIIALRQKGTAPRDMAERVRRVQSELELQPESYRNSIVLQACRDLIGESANGRGQFALKDFVRTEFDRTPDDRLARYLFYRYRYDMFPLENRIDDYPPCLQVEVTSVCNYRCLFCYQTDRTFTHAANGNNMGTMPMHRFKAVIDQAQGHIEAIGISCRGEPLACPTIKEMLAYASGKFLALKLNTNAWFLDERMSHAILSADLGTVVFSADAASEPLYSQYRVHGKLDRVLKNIERFQQIRQKEYSHSQVITRVSGVRHPQSPSLDDMESLWGALVDQVVFVAYNPWEKTYEMPVHSLKPPCSDLWRRLFVWFDGKYNPCDVDYLSKLSVGTFPELSLTQVWRSDAYERMRANHLAGRRSEHAPCNRCVLV